MSSKYQVQWLLIKISVKPNKKSFKISKNDCENKNESESYIVETISPPIENRCNKEITKELAKYFKTQQELVKIVKGHNSRSKYIQIGIKKDGGLKGF